MEGRAVSIDPRAWVAEAVLAPSSHNTQPWLFRLTGEGIELLADRTRALPVNDPEDRELAISCGCALANLRFAAAAAGAAVDVATSPDPGEPDLLARIVVARGRVSAEEAALAARIAERRTYRKPFAPEAVPPTAVAALVAAARAEGAALAVLATDDARRRACDLVAEGDAVQWADPRWRRELAAWMHPRRRGDGLTAPALAAPFTRLVVRSFDMGRGVGAKDRELAEQAPLLAVLSTESDDEAAWLRAGQALQRVLLTACAHGLQASYLNQPIQVAPLRPRLGSLAGPGWPQVFLRIGRASDTVDASPRRPVDAVLDG